MKLNKLSLFETAFNASSEGFIVVNNKSEIIITNKTMTSLFGYLSDELIGQKIELLVPTEYKKGHVSQRDQYHKKPTNRSMGQASSDLMAQRKDGSKFAVSISLNPFELEGEKLVLALISNVTEKRETSRELEKTKQNLHNLNSELENLVIKRTLELKKSQNLYQLIADNFPDGIISVLDTDFNYVFVAGKELKKLNINTEQLLNTSFIERVDPDLKTSIEENLNLVLQGKNLSQEIEYKGNDYELNMVAMHNVSGVIDQILIVESNITRQKTNEKEQEIALQKERELGIMKSRFVSMASHEFRTPLSAILSSASLINKYPDTDQQDKRTKHTARIKASVNNLTSILNDFLSFDKLSSGKIEATLSECNLKTVMLEALEEISPLKSENQNLEIKVTDHIMDSDPKLLKNVFINLLSNAFKYTSKEGNISVSFHKKESGIEIHIKDDGIGIPKADQEQLFNRFFRAQNATNIQGTGLGLNIVKKYIELLGGEIQYNSVENEGTTFIITL